MTGLVFLYKACYAAAMLSLVAFQVVPGDGQSEVAFVGVCLLVAAFILERSVKRQIGRDEAGS